LFQSHQLAAAQMKIDVESDKLKSREKIYFERKFSTLFEAKGIKKVKNKKSNLN
jgi:hypothetical protein